MIKMTFLLQESRLFDDLVPKWVILVHFGTKLSKSKLS